MQCISVIIIALNNLCNGFQKVCPEEYISVLFFPNSDEIVFKRKAMFVS